jgi:CRISPR-associated protein Csm1
LWQALEDGLSKIPSSHKNDWAIWLEHFDTLWMMVSHAIPSATSQYTGVRPDVSLYDHSKTTAAFATAMWRYHEENQHDKEKVTLNLKTRQGDHGWDEKKLLLVQGDFFGIQDFIFAHGGETQRNAAKLLRGRSFFVSLLTELAALKILEALSLPPTSLVLNAAGKFLIVAHNTSASKAAIERVENEINQWFLDLTYGQQGMGIATLEASCNDFIVADKNASEKPFSRLMKSLFEVLERKKLARFNLFKHSKEFVVRNQFLKDFNNELGACAITGNLPAHNKKDGVAVSKLAADQITVGQELARSDRNFIAIGRDNIPGQALKQEIFGYRVSFVDQSVTSNAFAEHIKQGKISRVFDVSPPVTEHLWQGFARRFINAQVPRFVETDKTWELAKYKSISEEDFDSDNRIKTFNHIACEDRQPTDEKLINWRGIVALGVLKGDVDNLGLIFQSGIRDASFARMATLSRQLNNFFAVYLPWLCHQETKFRNTYTVFAGGDDFFLIGPWRSQMQLAQLMREKFTQFVANKQITFSAALVNLKPGIPVRHFGEFAEAALEQAKSKDEHKDKVYCFAEVLQWHELRELLIIAEELEQEREKNPNISTGFTYGLLQLARMAEEASHKVEANKWRAHLAYRIKRLLIDRNQRLKSSPELAKEEALRLKTLMGGKWIETYKGKLAVALQTHLYSFRD